MILKVEYFSIDSAGELEVTMVTSRTDYPNQGITLSRTFTAGWTRTSVKQAFRAMARDAWAITELGEIDPDA
jgi:hypothetical protein